MRDGGWSHLAPAGFASRLAVFLLHISSVVFLTSHLIWRFPMSTFLTSHLAFLLGTLFLTSHLSFWAGAGSHLTSRCTAGLFTSHISAGRHKNHPSLSQGVLAGLIRRVGIFRAIQYSTFLVGCRLPPFPVYVIVI